MPIVIFTYSNCDTCRKATKWLAATGLQFIEKPIRETPPSLNDLRKMLRFHRGELRSLFNVAGREFRALQLKDKLPGLSNEEALLLLSQNGSLVKRPFLLSEEIGLLGFDKAVWEKTFFRPEGCIVVSN